MRMGRIASALLPLAFGLGLLAGGGPAAWASETPDAAAAARAAAQQIDAAATALAQADSARDRVRALSETTRAFEAGLEAMRDGMRRAVIREQALAAGLQAQQAELAQLLAALQTMGHAPAPVLMLHPSGPAGTARAGMILADITPALAQRAQALRVQLEEMQTLRLLQDNAADTLRRGLQGAQEARTELSQAIADRKPLPRRFVEDPVRTAILIASAETLEGFASGLSQIARDEPAQGLPDISHRKGALPLPVQGALLRRAGEADAAGLTRPGILLATRPYALVTTPAAATVRYRGPLLDYGNVMILEPQAGLLLVLAGLEQVFGAPGEVLPAGSPVGLMGGQEPQEGTIVVQSGEGAGNTRSETLYIEVRENNQPVDPALWFAMQEG
ncbi:MAG: murein hydrolase activator EnvC family protein [Lutimaribacter sp.]